MSTSPVSLRTPLGASPATPTPSNKTPSTPITSAQAAIQKSPTSASSPKISKTVETFDAKLLQGLKDAGHALPPNAQKPLKNFLAAVYQSFKADGKDITQVKSAFQALQKAMNPSSQKALPIILNSAKAWAKGRLKDGWNTTSLRKFFNSNLVKPEKQVPADSKSCLSTTGKVVLGLTLAAGVGLLVYKYALPFLYPSTVDDQMTNLYNVGDVCLDPQSVAEEMTNQVDQNPKCVFEKTAEAVSTVINKSNYYIKSLCPSFADLAPFTARWRMCSYDPLGLSLDPSYTTDFKDDHCPDSSLCRRCRRMIESEVSDFCKKISENLAARLIGNGRT